MIDLCGTRWAARHDAYTHFYAAYTSIIETLEVIAHHLHGDRFQFVNDVYPDWDNKSKNDAASLLTSLTDFTFIVNFLTTYKFLSYLAGITVKLQSRSLDILEAYSMVST